MQEPLIVRLLIVRTLKCKAQIWNLWFESVDLNPQNVTAEPKQQIITPDFTDREAPRFKAGPLQDVNRTWNPENKIHI